MYISQLSNVTNSNFDFHNDWGITEVTYKLQKLLSFNLVVDRYIFTIF